MKAKSPLSITQVISKKMKNSTKEKMPSNDVNSNQSNQDNYTLYKPSKYLKMS